MHTMCTGRLEWELLYCLNGSTDVADIKILKWMHDIHLLIWIIFKGNIGEPVLWFFRHSKDVGGQEKKIGEIISFERGLVDQLVFSPESFWGNSERMIPSSTSLVRWLRCGSLSNEICFMSSWHTKNMVLIHVWEN